MVKRISESKRVALQVIDLTNFHCQQGHSLYRELFATILFINVYDIIFIGENRVKEVE